MFSNETIIGGIVGLTQNLIGHPFDTLKVLVQNGTKINKTHLRPSILYAGVTYPMGQLILSNALVFEGYNRINNKYKIGNFNSAFICGLIFSPVTYLYECGKIYNQTKNFINNDLNNEKKKYSYLSYFRKGFIMTAARESFGMGFYFSTYYYVKDELKQNSLISGGLAGIMSWSTTYQFDVIKSRQMAYNIGFIEAFKKYNFWKGYSYCITRAVLVNSISFYVYDYLSNITK
jgi:hypothetical protein